MTTTDQKCRARRLSFLSFCVASPGSNNCQLLPVAPSRTLKVDQSAIWCDIGLKSRPHVAAGPKEGLTRRPFEPRGQAWAWVFLWPGASLDFCALREVRASDVAGEPHRRRAAAPKSSASHGVGACHVGRLSAFRAEDVQFSCGADCQVHSTH